MQKLVCSEDWISGKWLSENHVPKELWCGDVAMRDMCTPSADTALTANRYSTIERKGTLDGDGRIQVARPPTGK